MTVATISLPCGTPVVIDDADRDWLGSRRWRRLGNGYAATGGHRKPPLIYMHRLILGLEPGDRSRWADHINGDKLDNRRGNLRIVTPGQNAQNQPGRPGTTSRFRNVYWDPGAKRWLVGARLKGRSAVNKHFRLELAAAVFIDRWRAEHMPFAQRDPEYAALLAGGLDPEAVLRAEVEARKQRPAPATHCKRGHAFDDANTYIDARGCRRCRTCLDLGRARYIERKRGMDVSTQDAAG